MTTENALKQIQLMHEQKLITKDSIIGWYSFYSNKLPKMKPGRSSADLVRTISLWMELTEKGGSPEFPYDYNTDINLSHVPTKNEKPDILFGVNWLIIIIGLILLFFNFYFGLTSFFIGILFMIINYKFKGGSKNIDTVTRTKDGKKVIEWIQEHS